MTLARYHQKRHFKRTSEPKGKIDKASEALFVIQKHAASHLHYDFRLAINGVLKSWAVPKGPCLDPSVKRLAVEVEDHPLEYATFEGTIPEGEYGAGEVIVWDYGKWESNEDLCKAYKKGSLLFTLQGHKVSGTWKLIKLQQSKSAKRQWLLIKSKDEYSKKLDSYDVTVEQPQSVFSGKALNSNHSNESKIKKDVATKKLIPKNTLSPAFKPELATLSTVLPQGNNWIYETKFDGYRILAFIENNTVKLISRNNQDWSDKFSSIKTELSKLKQSFTLLDGELVVLDENKKSNFQSLQNHLNNPTKQKNLHYFVFDIPIHQEKNLTSLPLIERKKILKNEIFNKEFLYIHYTEHLEGDAETLLNKACKQGLEGIIAKVKASPYRQTRTEDWLKLKCHQRQEFIVIGYTEPEGSRIHFGSLLLAYYDKKKNLIYAGHVGTGFNRQSLKMLYNKFAPLEQVKMPLAVKPIDRLTRQVHWLKPQIIIEVEFTEWTRDGILRHPSYQGLRIDKSPQEITRELAIYPLSKENKIPKNKIQKTRSSSSRKNSVSKMNKNIEFTHPDKILFPKVEISKLDLANYYARVSAYLLPHIQNRPISIMRCPASTLSKCFLQKHWATGLPKGLEPINITSKDHTSEYLTIKDQEGLMGLAQLAVLEIHPWASSNNKLDYPDQLIFDLDPDEKISWKELVSSALIIHETLDNLDLTNFVKLTGGKGMHVVVPIQATQHYDDVKKFAKQLAEKLSKFFPKLFTATISKKDRVGKIFIDYLRNAKEATAIAPFSPRHDDNASIAVPISWKKLPTYKSSKAYSIKTIEKYFRDYPNDPWEKFFHSKQTITKKLFEALQKI